MKYQTPSLPRILAIGCITSLFFLTYCDRDNPPGKPDKEDPNIVRTPKDLKEDRSFVSPPTLQHPIYACAQTVVVKNFIVGAKLEIFVNGTSVATETGIWNEGAPVKLPNPLTEGQEVYAKQIYGVATSDPSNKVIVTNYLSDYPSGLPSPRISRSPLFKCGRAIGIEDAVPGATVKAFAENPKAGGGFDPPVQIGSVADFGYMFVTALKEGAHVYLEQSLCTETSPRSSAKTVDPEPATIPPVKFDPTPIQGANIVVVWGPTGYPSEVLNGADIRIEQGGTAVGGQPTPGGGQQVFVNPVIDHTKQYSVTEALCTTSPPTVVTPLPCSALKAPVIYPPLPGDTQIEVIECHPGAEILVFANGDEIGDSGFHTIILERPIAAGETILVVQKLGEEPNACISATAVSIVATCNQDKFTNACGDDWPAFRQSGTREANQPHSSKLGNPDFVRRLDVRWRFTPPDGAILPQGFTASPIVYKGKVYIGGSNGRMYALNANTGALLWQFPAKGSPEKVSDYTCNPSSFGIAASAMIGLTREGKQEAVIFAAPDRTFGTRHGSSRLFALNINTGAVIWESPEVAMLTGTTAHSFSELHEQTGYSSPLVYNNRVYVGVANHCDNPIQKGKVKSVDLNSGNITGGFHFESVPNAETGAEGRGGGVWNSPAGGYSNGIYFTTGNSNLHQGLSEPKPNHGLSLIKINQQTGDLVWKLQPVPYEMDGDPDWAAGALVTHTPCGEMTLSTMKDGWSYGVKSASAGAFVPAQWQFPPTGTYNSANGHYFTPADGTNHGDTRYLVPGAAWNGTYISMVGGEETVEDLNRGFNRLHSLNACNGAVRWMANIPGASPGSYQLGPPSVTKGIVFVGTAQGHLVAVADPSVYATALSRCSHSGFSVGDCQSNGFSVVKQPLVLLDINLSSGSLVRNEPVIANDRIFISTGSGQVIMLEPR